MIRELVAALLPRPAGTVTDIVPLLIVVAPVKVLAPPKVSVPVPFCVKLPGPEMIEVKDGEEERLKTSDP